jgi:hypothetical protein
MFREFFHTVAVTAAVVFMSGVVLFGWAGFFQWVAGE